MRGRFQVGLPKLNTRVYRPDPRRRPRQEGPHAAGWPALDDWTRAETVGDASKPKSTDLGSFS